MTVLSRRALNRALLARQMLLERDDRSALDAIEHLVGMQAQAPLSPYVGLWTRLADFRAQELAELMLERAVVRIGVMRATIHLLSARDARTLRPLTAPVLERVFAPAKWIRESGGMDPAAVLAVARELVEEQPRTRAELRRLLEDRLPGRDDVDLSRVVFLLDLVQVTPRGVWGSRGQATLTTATAWLGAPLDPTPSVGRLFERYLGAFGPASVMDAQNWSGLTRLAEVAERLRPRLVSFRDDNGRELFDLPDAPRPDPDTPAPVRFLPEFDNLLLGHQDRTRVMEPEHRTPLFPGNGSRMGTVLIDGFYRALWRIVREGETARLVVEPHAKISKRDAASLRAEGRRLLAFAAPDARAGDVDVLAPV